MIIICVALVLGSDDLKPIQWRVWAGNLEREGRKGAAVSGTDKGKIGGDAQVGGYAWLERGQRRGFLDIRGQRREFAEWVRESAGGGGEKVERVDF